MKKFRIFTLILLIGFSSCRKEEITDINIIETEDPTEIDGVFFKGKIINGNINIANASIYVYEDEKLIGTVMSNKEGNFNTAGLKLNKNKQLTFYVKKGGFPNQAKRSLGTENVREINFNLQADPDSLSKQDVFLSPGSSNLIILSGYVFDINSNPVKDALVFAYHDSIPHPWISDRFQYIGVYSATDETGKYELLVPKDKVINLNVYQFDCTLGTPPHFNAFTKYLTLTHKNIGSFSQNAELANINNGVISSNSIESVDFTGTALNCMGEPIKNGQIKLQFHFDGNIKIDDQTQIINGRFKYKSTFCRPINRDIPIKILIKSIDAYNTQESEWVEKYNTFESLENLSITSCLPYDGAYYSFELKDYSMSLPIGNGFFNENTLRASEYWSNVSNWFNFEILNPKLGENDVQRMTYNLNPNNLNQELIFFQDTNEIKANITKIENNSFEGSFAGKVLSIIKGNKEVVEVKGRFRIRI